MTILATLNNTAFAPSKWKKYITVRVPTQPSLSKIRDEEAEALNVDIAFGERTLRGPSSKR